MGLVISLITFPIILLMIVSFWKVFVKAGRKGWESLIPIYGTIILAQIGGLPGWVGFLDGIAPFLTPYLDSKILLAPVLILSYMINYNLAKAFGKDFGFAMGLIICPFVFYPILAFDKKIHYILEK